MKSPETKRRLRRLLLLDLCIAALILLFYLLSRAGIGIPCVFRCVTGLLCPGCGNSRAALALLQLDLAAALKYNPLFPVEFFYLAWVYCVASRTYLRGGRFTYQPALPAVDGMILIAVITWGILRNLL